MEGISEVLLVKPGFHGVMTTCCSPQYLLNNFNFSVTAGDWRGKGILHTFFFAYTAEEPPLLPVGGIDEEQVMV
jgi:hypothetical protein